MRLYMIFKKISKRIPTNIYMRMTQEDLFCNMRATITQTFVHVKKKCFISKFY